MGSYYIKSIIGEIAKGIEDLISQNIIKHERKIILYGLDRYSFAMRTILSNLGYNNIEGYVSEDEALVVQFRSEIKNFACKFLNQEKDIINVWTIKERLSKFDNQLMILIASKEYMAEKSKLEALGYQEYVHFYVVYDFKDKELDSLFKRNIRMSLDEQRNEISTYNN